MPKALIWGESLVGGGHARIQSELARQLQSNGWEVACVTGSKAHTDNFDFGDALMIYQAPLRLKSPESDPYNMTNLITPNGETLFTDAAYRNQRRERLLAFYHAYRPDAVVTEMWPYARANFDFEVVPLARAILADVRASSGRSPPLYSIARDIMFPPRLSSPDSPGLADDRYALAAEFFAPGRILVRGDPNVIALEESIGVMPDGARDRIDYVGYFASSPSRNGGGVKESAREVLVSSGGGVTRDSILLFKRAIAARKFSSLRDRVWRIIIPHGCPAEVFADIAAAAKTEAPDGGIIVEHNRRDFLDLLANAALVICHAGNTVVEAVVSGVAVLVVPRGLSKNNLEQQVRAQAFFDKNLIELATLAEIEDPRTLADKAARAVCAARDSCPILVDGAARMARRITAEHAVLTERRPDIWPADIAATDAAMSSTDAASVALP